jgi:hypothetical protein
MCFSNAAVNKKKLLYRSSFVKAMSLQGRQQVAEYGKRNTRQFSAVPLAKFMLM